MIMLRVGAELWQWMVDGGSSYLKRTGDPADIEELEPFVRLIEARLKANNPRVTH